MTVTVYLGNGLYTEAHTRREYARLQRKGGVGLGVGSKPQPRHGEVGVVR